MTTVTSRKGITKKTVCRICKCDHMKNSKSFGDDVLVCSKCGSAGWDLVSLTEKEKEDKNVIGHIFAY